MVAVILATAFQLAVPDCSSVFSSYARGRRWDFTITVAALEKAPTWREDEASPPLSPREAISIASLRCWREKVSAGESTAGWFIAAILQDSRFSH